VPEPDQSSRVIRFGVFEVDLHTTELRKQGVRIRLPLQSFQVLEALLLQPGELVTRKELKEKLWPADSFGDFEHGLNAAVNRVREALGDSSDNPRFVETLPRRGYRFLASVNAAPQSSAAGVIEDGEAGKRVASPVKPPRSRRPLLLLAIILGVVSPLVAWLWIRHREAKQPEPDFQRLSFGRGMIQSARFAPDGQSVIYGAAWDGKPVQLFWSRANSPESRPLGVEADILAVSPSGEMAVLLNQHYGNIASQGTLALMSLTGSAPRKLLDSVQDADWSPDGSKLAITHYVGGRCALEFPLGKVLYRTTGGAWLSHPRVSPHGDQIAYLEHPVAGNNFGFLAVIDRNGRKKTLSSEFDSLSGMAWDPAGDSIWFSGSDATTRGVPGLFKVTLAGLQHQVRRESGYLTLHDVSQGRRLLLTRDSIRGEVFGRIHSESKEHELGWLDNSYAADLSPDGATIVLSVQGEASATGYQVYLRKTDDSPAVRLGEGLPRQLSPDAKWVLTSYPYAVGIEPTPPPQVLLLATGTGESVTLTHDSISHFSATLLPKGKTLVFEGNEPGHARRSWIQNVGGGKPLPITPEGTVGHRVSPDEKLLVAVDPEQKYWLYPIGGGPPAPLSFMEPGEDVIRWSADGKHLFVASDGIPVAIYRVEILSGRRQLVGKVAPSDLAGVWNIGPVLITPDGRSYVYSDYRILSDLFLATGLR
jgi:eukaryotic-like serine/threonine-protein kinase